MCVPFLLVLLQKKLSIFTTVSRVVKYIPELQKQVDGLEKKELTNANYILGALKMSKSINSYCLCYLPRRH
jgi:hypothetical protein